MTSTLGLPPKAMGRNKNSVLQLIFQRCGCRKRAAGLQARLFHSQQMRRLQDAGSEDLPPQKRICPKQFSSAPDEKLDCLALLTMR